MRKTFILLLLAGAVMAGNKYRPAGVAGDSLKMSYIVFDDNTVLSSAKVQEVADTTSTPEPGMVYFVTDDSLYYTWQTGGYWLQIGSGSSTSLPDSAALYDSLSGAWQSEISDSLNLTMLKRLTSDDFHNLGGTDANTTYTADESSLTLTGSTFGIKLGGITNNHIATGAAIAGTKINPDFGSQNVANTGYLTSAHSVTNPTGSYTHSQLSSIVNYTAANTNWSREARIIHSANVSAGLNLSVYPTALDVRLTKEGTGIVGGAYGVYSQICLESGQDLTKTFSAFSASSYGPIAGTLGVYRAYYMPDLNITGTVGKIWGLYLADPDASHYLMGSTGINREPGVGWELDVEGDIRATGVISADSTNTDHLVVNTTADLPDSCLDGSNFSTALWTEIDDSANAAISAITWSGDLGGTGTSPSLADNTVHEAEINWGGVDEDSLLAKINAATGKLSTSAADTAEWTAFVRNHQVTGGYDGNAGPNNAIKYDRKGNANEMVWIPRFNWDRTNGFNSSTIHPAFVVDGAEIKGFWVAKYECVVLDSSTSAIYSAGTLNTDTHHYIANSQPNVAPRHTITFDAARRACDNMNNGSTITGYHLMTNAEWAAVALWCKDNATMPYGNNNYGRDVEKKHLSGTIIGGDTFGSGTSRWLTGSGGPTTTHNWVNGIADMNGNLWEWVDGFKVNEGKIYVMGNDNTTPTWGGNSFAAAESTWYDTGMWVNWDGTASYCSFSAVGRDSVTAAAKSTTFGTTTGADSLLQALAIGPVGSNAAAYGYDYVYFRNDGLRLPLRSGSWTHSTRAGVFYLYVDLGRSYSYNFLGFRAALVEE